MHCVGGHIRAYGHREAYFDGVVVQFGGFSGEEPETLDEVAEDEQGGLGGDHDEELRRFEGAADGRGVEDGVETGVVAEPYGVGNVLEDGKEVGSGRVGGVVELSEVVEVRGLADDHADGQEIL